MSENPRWFSPPAFGLRSFSDLFTSRQLVTLGALADLVAEATVRISEDAVKAGRDQDSADAYATCVSLYLALAVSRIADMNNSFVQWSNTRDQAVHLFGRQAIPMVWDYAEVNPFARAAGDLRVATNSQARVLDGLRPAGHGSAQLLDVRDLASNVGGGFVIATDPPYYDNIGYADLSDFFYLWLRRSLRGQFPLETTTILTPKDAELIASPFRHGGREGAQQHFESGLVAAFAQMAKAQDPNYPLTLFYAFKQTETDADGIASTGWETMLNGLMHAGLSVSATWPMRTERDQGLKTGTNVLASSVVLACRPRSASAKATTRRGLLGSLRESLPGALRALQQASIAPVDLAQAAIGPGMAVFSSFAKVVEADGSDMTVRTALALINQVLDEVLSEQEGDFDADTRFCVKWFAQFGWNEALSGEADVLARAANTSVDGLVRGGVFRAVAGRAALVAPEDLSENWDPNTDYRISDWEVVLRLAKSLDLDGAEAASSLMIECAKRVDLDTAKELAYLLFSLSEKKGWAQSALLFNALGTSWSDLNSAARRVPAPDGREQATFAFDDDE